MCSSDLDFGLADPTATVGGMAGAGRLDICSGATGAILRSTFGTSVGQLHGRSNAVGDLDGDGKRDFLMRGAGNTALAIASATGQSLFAVPGTFLGTDVCNLGDLDGDGREEFTHSYFISGKGYAFGAWYVINGRTGAAIWTYPLPSSSQYFFWQPRGVGDLDRDGRADLLLNGTISTPGVLKIGRAHV